MNPMDDPNQSSAYLAKAKQDAEKMADEMRRQRDAAPKPPPTDRCNPTTIGLLGGDDSVQTIASQ